MTSVDTRQAQRDGHLKSEDFFNVEKYPNVTFTATKITADGDDEYEVTGDLTIRDVTKPLTLEVSYEGTGKDPNTGNMVAGFEAKGKFNRKDFGLNYNLCVRNWWRTYRRRSEIKHPNRSK